MIILSNSIAQTIEPGQSATFDTVVLQTGKAEYHRPNSGAVRLLCKCGLYDVSFGGNIGATEEGAAQLAIAYDNSPLLETTMISQTAAAGNLNNVSNSTAIRMMCCDSGLITVINTGTTTVNIGVNPKLKISRRG